MNTPNPDPATAWQVILTLGVLVAIGANMITMFRVNRKQQREVSFSFEPASKKEFDQFTITANANFVQIRDEMKQDRADNQKHASERSKTLFAELKDTRLYLDKRINRLSIGVAGLCARQGIKMPNEEDEA